MFGKFSQKLYNIPWNLLDLLVLLSAGLTFVGLLLFFVDFVGFVGFWAGLFEVAEDGVQLELIWICWICYSRVSNLLFFPCLLLLVLVMLFSV